MQTMYVFKSEIIGHCFLYILFLVKFGYWYSKVAASFSSRDAKPRSTKYRQEIVENKDLSRSVFANVNPIPKTLHGKQYFEKHINYACRCTHFYPKKRIGFQINSDSAKGLAVGGAFQLSKSPTDKTNTCK